MQEFTLEQIGMQVTALQSFFDQVTLIDPLAQAEVDPATLQATGHADAVPVLNADGRGWQPILGEDTGFVFYQNIQVEHRPFVLAATYFLTADLPANDREANALLRLLGQYREEMRRDYVTGVYNRAFLDSAYRKKVAAAACAGKPVSVVAARVNEYWNLLREEGTHAADCCLNTAAGILQLAAGPDQQNAVVRLEDGIFLVVSVGIGSVIYYIVMQICIWFKIDTDLLKMLSAIVVAIFLAVPYWKAKYFTRVAVKKGGSSNA